MANTAQLGAYGDLSNESLSFRNKLINGGFDIWQRNITQTSSGIGSDDRWLNGNVGSTKTASRQTFTLGQSDVPGNPKYFARTVVATVAGASNFCYKTQIVENVATLAGQTATLSFWAKADAPKNIAIEFIQGFGTGGSPSSAVTGIGVTTVALTASWAKYTVTTVIPSISGKVLGSNNNDYLEARFWFDAGSSFNSRTNSLGQQSGTFDIANVQLEAGTIATPFEIRGFATELQLCQRYYEKSFNYNVLPASALGDNRLGIVGSYSGASVAGYIPFKVRKRASGSATIYNALISTANTVSVFVSGSFVTTGTATPPFNEYGINLDLSASGASTGSSYLLSGHWTAETEL